MAELTRHRNKNPRNCERCRGLGQMVVAEYNLKPEGRLTMYLCATHAAYWSAQHGVEFVA